MTAYEMRISDWSSDVCSSDLALVAGGLRLGGLHALADLRAEALAFADEAHAHAAPVQFHPLALERGEDQLHPRADLFLRPAPVIAGEREPPERGGPQFEAEVAATVTRQRPGAEAPYIGVESVEERGGG